MTRRRKKGRPPEVPSPDRPQSAAPGPGNSLAASPAAQVRMPYRLAAVCGLLLAAVLIVFGQTISYDFVNLDDNTYVYNNRHVRAGLTGQGLAWAFTGTDVSAHWHPLTWLSLMADAQMLGSGEGPLGRARLAAGMHLVNVALHAANAVILFLVLRAMTASVWRSAFVAAVFAVHPLHVESVAWITERKDVLSGLFGLLVVGVYAWYTRGPSVVRYCLVAITLALGLMAKPMLVTWPLLFLLLDYWPLQRPLRMHLMLEKVPLLPLVAASAVVAFLGHRASGAVVSLETVPLSERIARAAVLYVAYLGKTFWPVNLAAVYPREPMASYWPAWGAGVLLALLTAGALWGARRGQRWLAVGWFWYLGTLLPTIGLVQVGLQVMADRFLYLPQIGICVALAWGTAHLPGPCAYRRCLLAALSAVVVAGLMVCAWQQTSYWRNSEQLWMRTLACTAHNPTAHNSLGAALFGRGRIDEAMAHYRKALEIKPDDAEANYNLGIALASRGQVNEAFPYFQKAVKINPDYAEAHDNLGVALARRGQNDEAIAHFRKALEIKPEYAAARTNLGAALARCGRVDEAIAQYRKALEIKPEYVQAHINLGDALAGRGRLGEALEHYQKALDVAIAHNDRTTADAIRARIKLHQ